MIAQQSDAIRSIMETIVQSFSDVDDENRKKAEEIRDVIIGSPGYARFSDGGNSIILQLIGDRHIAAVACKLDYLCAVFGNQYLILPLCRRL